MHFKGKVSIVTGGSSGIGKETAKPLVAHGASVVLSGREEANKIRINAVAPAVAETPIYSTFLSKEEVPKVLSTFNAFHPLGRILQPGDVTEAVLFFASDVITLCRIHDGSASN